MKLDHQFCGLFPRSCRVPAANGLIHAGILQALIRRLEELRPNADHSPPFSESFSNPAYPARWHDRAFPDFDIIKSSRRP